MASGQVLNNPVFVLKVENDEETVEDSKSKKLPKTAKQKALTASLMYICENTSNLTKVFISLIERDVISNDEHQEIMTFPTDTKKLLEVMRLVGRKEPEKFAIFSEILTKTGNEHVAKKIQEKEAGLSDDVVEPDNDEPDDPDKPIDENCPDGDDLRKFFDETKEKLRTLQYFPNTLFCVSRFNGKPMGSSLPSENFQNVSQKFRSNRAVFLKKVGFYGPAAIPLTSYEISIDVTFWRENCTFKPIAAKSEVIEVAKDQLMFIEFDDAVAIRPHVWHCINFTIQGLEKMVHQIYQPTNKMAYVDYKKNVYDAVRIEFDMSNEFSTGQAPEYWFFKAKDRIKSDYFPQQEETDLALAGQVPQLPKDYENISDPVNSDCNCSIV